MDSRLAPTLCTFLVFLGRYGSKLTSFRDSLDGSQFVQTSVNINQPVIYVAMNYRFVETLPAKLTVRSSFM